MDWKISFLNFLNMIGEETDEWHPELWEHYEVIKNKKEAQIILEEYRKLHEKN